MLSNVHICALYSKQLSNTSSLARPSLGLRHGCRCSRVADPQCLRHPQCVQIIRRLLSQCGAVLALVAALSLAGASGAHHFDRQDAAQLALAQFYGVASLEICGDTGGPVAKGSGCPVCHLVGAVLLPEIGEGPARPLTLSIAVAVTATSQIVPGPRINRAHGTRAPPLQDTLSA